MTGTWRPYVYDLRWDRDLRKSVLVQRGGYSKSDPTPWTDVAVFYDPDEARKVLRLLPQDTSPPSPEPDWDGGE